MPAALPTAVVQVKPSHWNSLDPASWPWSELSSLPPLRPASGTGEARYPTQTRICADPERLYVNFECQDPDIWGTLTERDAAIYDEEVVELFIAAGEADPITYYEFEISPLGTVLDLVVHSPNGDRRGLRADFAWDCPGLWTAVHSEPHNQRWTATFSIPWRSLAAEEGPLPSVWRANFYRIERPHGQAPDFTCWSPTYTEPADYHRPARFGYLQLPTSLTGTRA